MATYKAHLVIRKRGKTYAIGFASQLLKGDGWVDIKDLGYWYGSQMSYSPYRNTYNRGQQYCDRMNKKLKEVE